MMQEQDEKDKGREDNDEEIGDDRENGGKKKMKDNGGDNKGEQVEYQQ